MMRRALALSVLAAATLAASPARADDVSDLEGLLDQTVVTTASKSAETGSTAPALSTTITAEDLRRYGIHSLDEAIDFLSLGVVTSNPGKAVDIGARGIILPSDSGNHFLLLVNGHQLNEPLYGSARFERGLGIPFEMVDHIEVVLGPGSVLYGSNAMFGVINVITKQAKDWSGVHVIGETEIAKSYRVAAGAGTQFTLLGKPAWLTLGAEYYTQDGPALTYDYMYTGIDPASVKPYKYTRNGPADGYWGGVARNGYYARVPSGLLRVVWGDFELNVNAKTYKRAVPYRSRYQSNFFDFDDPDSYELDRHLWVDLTHHARLSSIVELTTRVYGDTWDYQAYRNSSEASACLTAGDSTIPTCTFYSPNYSRWAGIEARTAFDWLKNARLVTTIGVDERIRMEGLKIDALDFYTRRPLISSFGIVDRQDELFGAYLQQTWQPITWLSLNGGARVDNETRFHGVVSPRFAASANTWKGGTLKGVYAEAFRSPSVIETDLENPIQLKADNLRPERVRSVDVSVEQRLGTQRLLVGVFRSWWNDLVEQHVLTAQERAIEVQSGRLAFSSYGVAQFQNVSSIDNYGVNGSYEGAVGDEQQLRYGLTVTGAVTKLFEANGVVIDELPVAPALFGNARISYKLPGSWPTLGAAGHYLSKRPADRAYDGSWPAVPYADPQLELRGTISGQIPFAKSLSYRASINWLLANRGPYVVGPIQAAEPGNTVPQLVPLDTLRATVGLQWDFGQ
jgi:outer membrane receptor for ferrienterochelin and colicins